MQVVILAGGLGTRLRPLTFEIAKSMAPVNGRPFLEHQIKYLKQQGMKKILLCVGYLSEQVVEYFNDGKKFGVEIQYSVEREPLGTGGALKNAEGKIGEEFILVNGDTYLPLDYKRLLDFWKQKKKNVIVAYNNAEKIVGNNMFVKGGKVLAYSKNSSIGMNSVDAGVYVFNRDVLSFIPKNKKVSLETEIFSKLIEQKQLAGYVTSQRFYDMGTPERLKKMEEILK